ncbi:MAG: glycerophosphodiester phosphodiesterase [Thermoanaerobaculia bacterium]
MPTGGRRGRFALGPGPWIAGHRGAAPELENTLPAFAAALAAGADFVELDVQLTADGELVVFHDVDLGRLAGRPRLRIERSTAAELRATELVDPRSGARGRMPTLVQVFAALPAGFPLNVELKRERADREALLAALAPHLARPNLLLSSFDLDLLGRLRQRAPDAALAVLGERLDPQLAAAAAELEAWSVHVGEPALEALRRVPTSRPVIAFTVDDAERARALFAAGVAGVFSDRPGPLRESLDRAGGRVGIPRP